jgi:gluconokinase
VKVLALDVGTSSTRAIVHDENGHPVAKPAEVAWRPLPSGGKRVEFDLHRVAEAVDETVRQALRGGEVDAVAASCFWHSLALTDDRGEVVTPLLTWRDSRAEAEAEELARTLDAAAVHRRTGCPLHASFWPAKLLWLRRNDPWLDRGASAVSVSDVALGEPTTSVSMASATGMLNRETLAWDEELLDAVGVDVDQLPRVSDEPHTREGRTWFPAIGDGAAANLGSGAVGEGAGAITIGTSGALRVVHDRVRAPWPGLFQFRLDARRAVDGGSIADGGLLRRWLRRTLDLPKGEADDEILERPPASHGLVFLALLGGDRAPGWSPNGAGAIVGLTTETTAVDIRHAALEGVAFRFAAILDRLPEVDRLVGSGGTLRKSHALCQILADVLGRPLALPAVAEASARGAAVFALERLGVTVPELPLERVYDPRPDRAEALAEARARDRELYETLVAPKES